MSEDGEVAAVTLWEHGPARWSIVVHGGAGDVEVGRRPLHVAGCERAAAAGAAVLAAGGSALDAVQRAVETLEDDALFNAGTGAALNEDGAVELDAAIMDGAALAAGAVCALPPFKNPIAIARRVMEGTSHVLLAAEGAARFAVDEGFVRASARALITDSARAKLEAARAKPKGNAGGTVGAVAKDANGHVAAATSTGGMANKRVGRVGDSPVIGAGTYADDEAGACSTTGHGEAMLRVCLAKAAVDALRSKPSPAAAARASLATIERRTGARGGLITASADGSLCAAFSTSSMSWAAASDATTASGT